MPDLETFLESVKKGDLPAVRSAVTADRSLLNATNGSGQSALLLAKYYRQEEVASYILDLDPTLDVFNASVAGKTEEVLAQIGRDPSLLEAHSSDGWTPLHLAAFFGHADVANALLDHGANIEARSTNSMKNTPLHAAAAGGYLDVVKLLLDRGANVNAQQDGGWTALHSAAQSGNREMIETLIAHGADINARAANNQAPLDLALTKGHAEIGALLEELGARLQ